ncbi:MAG: hypothetical protein KDA22_07635 [Phycisphaerales bacterium]|nr:hypothetical protein [Phycisphaerales bacterium]
MAMTAGILGSTIVWSALAAPPLEFTGPGGDIPDDFNGRPGIFQSDIVVPPNGQLVSIAVRLDGMVHTFIGDLVVTVTHVPTGTTATLVSRVGKTSASSGVGDSSNLDGDYTFDDEATGSLWLEAEGGGSNFVVPPGDYFPSAPLTGVEAPIDPVFANLNVAGTWRLTISDEAPQDVGLIGSWALLLDVSGTSCPAQCLGDISGDGVVDGTDLGSLLAAWDTSTECADLSGDGTIDGADLGILLAAWGPCR